MAEKTQLDRIEAMLPELLRRYTPREAISGLEGRLDAYQPGSLVHWLETAVTYPTSPVSYEAVDG